MSIVSFLSYTEFIITRKTTEHYLSDVVAQCVGAHTRGGRLGGTTGMAHDLPFASARSSHVEAGTQLVAVRCAPLGVLDSSPCVSGLSSHG